MYSPMIVDETKCVGCGLCVPDCPKEAIRVNSNRKAEFLGQCVGCQICSVTCPRQAIAANPLAGEDYLTCDSCPVHCRIKAGQTGACKRFRHVGHELKREIPLYVPDPSEIVLDPLTRLPDKPLLTGIGSGTNLQKVPARIIAEKEINGVDIVTAVTEAVLSFSGLRIKLDLSDPIGPEGSVIRRDGKVVGYVTSAWYGSQTITIGGVTLIKSRDGFTAARTMIDLTEGRTVGLSIDGGAELELTAGRPPVINGRQALGPVSGNGSSPGTLNIIYVGGVGGGVMGALHPLESPEVASAIRAGKIRITSGGRPVHLMPGGNLIIEADAAGLPPGTFSWVATPATSMPVEFSMPKDVFLSVCGYPDAIKRLDQVLAEHEHVYLKQEVSLC